MSSQRNSNFLITLCLINYSDLMNIDFFLSEIFHGHLGAFECICSKTRTGNLRDYSVSLFISIQREHTANCCCSKCLYGVTVLQ